jgi:7-cyano-7-deazaguanine reductase
LDRILGNRVAAPEQYAPEILEPIDRALGRSAIEGASIRISNGWDVWHCYELSWLVEGVGLCYFTGTLSIPADSPFTVESKSLKLYLNSLNNKTFSSEEEAIKTIERDVSAIAAGAVKVVLWSSADLAANTFASEGLPRPETSLPIRRYVVPGFRSLCPVTAQPDWATVVVDIDAITFDRKIIDTAVEALRNHQVFHEQCIEDLFSRIERDLRPEYLEITGFFQRRGGIDITPRRSSAVAKPPIERFYEQ